MQIGVGVEDMEEALPWYQHVLGFTIKVFDDSSSASMMKKYTGNEVRLRRAVLLLNPNGGGGVELWQFIGYEPKPQQQNVKLNDRGITNVKLKCGSLVEVEKHLKSNGIDFSRVQNSSYESIHFKDLYGNRMEYIESSDLLTKKKNLGGVLGCTIGVDNLAKATFYFKDYCSYHLTNETSKSSLLSSESSDTGFGWLYGASVIELLKSDSESKILFKDRFWGAPGYIHLCFDVKDMSAWKTVSEVSGYPFTVDSQDGFDMEAASGRFSYSELEENTLLEFIQIYKVPIYKPLNISINLLKRKNKSVGKGLWKLLNM